MQVSSRINPKAEPITGKFFYASLDEHKPGDVIKKGPEPDDACLFGTEVLDECIFLGGIGYVYRVRGTSCRHYWPQLVTGQKQNLFGGYEDAMVGDTFPYTMHIFDELEVVERLPRSTVFGTNGAQVAHLVQWIRKKHHPKGDQIVCGDDFRKALESMATYVRVRAEKLTWPLEPFKPYSPLYIAEPEAVPSSRFWLRPRRFTDAHLAAWTVAYDRGYRYRCRWLTFSALKAVTLRKWLEPRHFTELYAPLEPYFPLATLDAEVRGELYKL